MPELGAGVDPRFFNPAPHDQQIAFFEGTETLLLEGLDPALPRITTHLGGVSVVVNERVLGGPAPGPLKPSLDMCILDPSKRRFSLVWRVVHAEAPDAVRLVERQRKAPPLPLTGSSTPNATRPAEVPRSVAPAQRAVTTADLLAAPRPPSPGLPFGAAPAAPSPAPALSAWRVRRVRSSASSIPRRSAGSNGRWTPSPRQRREPCRVDAPSRGERERGPAIPATPYDASFAPLAVTPAANALNGTGIIG
ncbi:MAG: DUF2169 domain-containing protein [Polyangiaceae bacterium]